MSIPDQTTPDEVVTAQMVAIAVLEAHARGRADILHDLLDEIPRGDAEKALVAIAGITNGLVSNLGPPAAIFGEVRKHLLDNGGTGGLVGPEFTAAEEATPDGD